MLISEELELSFATLNEVLGIQEMPEDVIDIVKKCHEEIPTHLLPLLMQFRNEGKAASPTFHVWDDFLFDVLIPLMSFLTSTQAVHWKVYQASKAKLNFFRSCLCQTGAIMPSI